jgi:hypothetical protein
MSEQTSISAARSFGYSLTERATRRDLLLFALVIAVGFFALDSLRPHIVIEVPTRAPWVDSPLGWISTSARPR